MLNIWRRLLQNKDGKGDVLLQGQVREIGSILTSLPATSKTAEFSTDLQIVVNYMLHPTHWIQVHWTHILAVITWPSSCTFWLLALSGTSITEVSSILVSQLFDSLPQPCKMPSIRGSRRHKSAEQNHGHLQVQSIGWHHRVKADIRQRRIKLESSLHSNTMQSLIQREG
jgi:hypothetical protein